MTKIFKLGDSPRTLTGAKAKFWIEVDGAPNVHGEGIVVGRECPSLGELEKVAEELKTDIDRVVLEARHRFGG